MPSKRPLAWSAPWYRDMSVPELTVLFRRFEAIPGKDKTQQRHAAIAERVYVERAAHSYTAHRTYTGPGCAMCGRAETHGVHQGAGRPNPIQPSAGGAA